MSTPILVALIAAIASVAATVVSLVAASRARRFALQQEQFRVRLKLSEERITRLRSLAADTERLRATGMLLRSALKTTGFSEAERDEIRERLRRLIDDFQSFWMRWAETKDDVPDSVLDRLRELRHELTPIFAATKIAVARGSRPEKRQTDRELHQRSVPLLEDLLLRLDAFYGEVAHLRSSAVEALLLADPNSISPSLRSGRIEDRAALEGMLPSRSKFTPSK